MQKAEAVEYLKSKGKDAALMDGIVIVTINNTGITFGQEYKRLHTELKTAGYLASFGARSCEKLEVQKP